MIGMRLIDTFNKDQYVFFHRYIADSARNELRSDDYEGHVSRAKACTPLISNTHDAIFVQNQ